VRRAVPLPRPAGEVRRVARRHRLRPDRPGRGRDADRQGPGRGEPQLRGRSRAARERPHRGLHQLGPGLGDRDRCRHGPGLR
jgi:hypothetical protein